MKEDALGFRKSIGGGGSFNWRRDDDEKEM